MSDLTFKEFEDMIATAIDLDKEMDLKKAEMKGLQDKLAKAEMKVMEEMKKLEKSSYDFHDTKVVLSKRFSVKQPKDPVQREAFFDYLRKKELFNVMISVNSQTLNGFYKAELEAAKEKGDFDFRIPGLEEPSYFEYLSMRKN